MKILKSHIRIIKQNENIRIDNVNQENRANLRILLQNNENHVNENYENNEKHKIP